MYCNNCGRMNNDQARFCASCAIALESVKEELTVQEGLTVSTTTQYANFGKRFGAAIIDGTLMIIFSLLFWFFCGWLLHVFTGVNPLMENDYQWIQYLANMTIFILNIAFFL